MQPETLISGENNLTYDAGVYQLASIGNYVWEDINGDDIQNEENAGMEGVTVNLTGTTGFGEAINLSTETDENGAYLFENLIPGSYQISLIPPTDYFITQTTQGTNESSYSEQQSN